MQRKSMVILIVVLLSILSACTDKQVAQNLNAYSAAHLAFGKSEIQLFNQGFVNVETHKKVMTVYLHLSEIGLELTTGIQEKTVNKAGALSLVNQALKSIETLNDEEALGIKNEKTKLQFKALVTAMKAPLTALVVLLGGK